jgi:quinone-modifying oxidoreductase subunit QmoB
MLADGGAKRKSDGSAAKTVAFVQCAGSRDPDHLPYCSSVCCGVSIKQALQIKEADPKASVYIIFQELRTPGTAEEFYRQAQEAGVIFMKGTVKSVDSELTVTVDDALLGEEVPMFGLDLVVLATGMVPNATNVDSEAPETGEDQLKSDIDPLSPIPVAGYAGDAPEPAARAEEAVPPGGPILNLQYRQGPHIPVLADGFADSHYICFPYETRRSGIYTCGPLRRPMDIAESAEDAAGAVLKAIQAVRGAAEGGSLHPRVGDLSFPKIGLDICTRCRRCTVECPFGAIDEDKDDYPLVNPTRCRRCGTCMGACPVRTISFDNYNIQMISEMINAVEVPDEFEEKPRILILACENDALRPHHPGALPGLGLHALGLGRAVARLRRHHADGLQVRRRLPVPLRQGQRHRRGAHGQHRRDPREHDAGARARRLGRGLDCRFRRRYQGDRRFRC